MEKEQEKKTSGQVAHRVFTVVGIILCVILLPILIINVTLIVKGTLDDSMPPSIFGKTPLVVLSGSMDNGNDDAIKVGDLIVVEQVDNKNLKVNDVVAFMEGKYAVTHRIVKVNQTNNGVTYTTRGDANNTDDAEQLKPENVIGRYSYQLSGVGNFVLFLQSTTGMLIFVGVPLILFIAYDVLRRRALFKTEKLKQEQLKKEIEDLKNNPLPITDKKEEPKDPWAYPIDALKEEEDEKPFWPHPNEARRAEPDPIIPPAPTPAPVQAAPQPLQRPRPAQQQPVRTTTTTVKKKSSSAPQVIRKSKPATRQVAVIKVRTVKK